MTGEPTKSLLLRYVTPELRRQLAAEADTEGTNVNDLIVAVLAAEFAFPYERTGRKAKPGRGDSIYLRMPEELHARVTHRALVQLDVSRQDLVTGLLHRRYGIRFASSDGRRGKPRRRRKATA